MNRIPVTSSAVAAIGYDPASEVLEIEYKPNKLGIAAVWQYRPVPSGAYELMSDQTQSVGKLLGTIKNDPSIFPLQLGTVQLCPDCGKTSEELLEHDVCPTCEAAKASVA